MAGDHSSGSDARHVAYALGRRDLLHHSDCIPVLTSSGATPIGYAHHIAPFRRAPSPPTRSWRVAGSQDSPLLTPAAPSVGLQRETADTLYYKQ